MEQIIIGYQISRNSYRETVVLNLRYVRYYPINLCLGIFDIRVVLVCQSKILF